MNDFIPLLAHSDDELELALLRSADDDEPSPRALPKAALALGVGAAFATSAAGSSATAAGALAKQGGITVLSLLKWLSVGVTAGLVTSGAVHLALRPESPAETGSAKAPGASLASTARAHFESAPPELSAEAEGAPASPPAAVPVALAPPAAPARAPSEPLATERPLPAGTAPPPAPGESSASFEPLAPEAPAARTPVSSLAEETRALDRVRGELEARRHAAAFALLTQFRERWPEGALRAEASVLRVEALLGAGDRASAEREAQGLIRIAPQSRHAARMRELLSR